MPGFGKCRFMINKRKAECLLFLLAIIPKTIFLLSPTEIYQINERRSYWKSPFLARLMENKATCLLYKYQKNIFQGLDPNFYFFANHPRERAGIKETEKFSWLFLIPFLAGLYWQFKQKFFWGFGYFILVLGAISVFQDFDRFVVCLFPFIFLSIILGIWQIFKWIF